MAESSNRESNKAATDAPLHPALEAFVRALADLAFDDYQNNARTETSVGKRKLTIAEMPISPLPTNGGIEN